MVRLWSSLIAFSTAREAVGQKGGRGAWAGWENCFSVSSAGCISSGKKMARKWHANGTLKPLKMAFSENGWARSSQWTISSIELIVPRLFV